MLPGVGMKPRDSDASDRKPAKAAWREAARELVYRATTWLARHHARRIGGGAGLGGGVAAMMIGLGPIGLSLIFLGIAMFLVEVEDYCRRARRTQAPSAPSRDTAKRSPRKVSSG